MNLADQCAALRAEVRSLSTQLEVARRELADHADAAGRDCAGRCVKCCGPVPGPNRKALAELVGRLLDERTANLPDVSGHRWVKQAEAVAKETGQ